MTSIPNGPAGKVAPLSFTPTFTSSLEIDATARQMSPNAPAPVNPELVVRQDGLKLLKCAREADCGVAFPPIDSSHRSRYHNLLCPFRKRRPGPVRRPLSSSRLPVSTGPPAHILTLLADGTVSFKKIELSTCLPSTRPRDSRRPLSPPSDLLHRGVRSRAHNIPRAVQKCVSRR